MNIVYSFNKKGYEAQQWEREIHLASNEEFTFIPFNTQFYLSPDLYRDAWHLDRLYQAKDPPLIRMYADLESVIRERDVQALIVTNCPPYHPDFLKRLSVYKVLYSGDDPDATYRRNIPYLHAYQHVFYCDPVYSPDMDMNEKMRYCGMLNADWLPLGVFDFEMDNFQTEQTLFTHERDIDIIYIGSFFRQKLNALAKVRKVFRQRVRLHGFFRLKHNLYYNVKYGFPGWISPISFKHRMQLYKRAKIGFNIHWNDYGLGNQRLYHLPANGVMQISDCSEHLERIYKVDEEIVGYRNLDDLISKLHFYLEHGDKRQEIAMRGYQRTMKDYRFGPVTRKAGLLIRQGMERIGWK